MFSLIRNESWEIEDDQVLEDDQMPSKTGECTSCHLEMSYREDEEVESVKLEYVKGHIRLG